MGPDVTTSRSIVRPLHARTKPLTVRFGVIKRAGSSFPRTARHFLRSHKAVSIAACTWVLCGECVVCWRHRGTSVSRHIDHKSKFACVSNPSERDCRHAGWPALRWAFFVQGASERLSCCQIGSFLCSSAPRHISKRTDQRTVLQRKGKGLIVIGAQVWMECD